MLATLDPIVVGWDHDANQRAEVPVPGDKGAHWLIGGASGGGKSQAIHAALAQLAERPNLALCINDAGLVDYQDWEPRTSSMALGLQGGAWLLEQAEREMHHRLRACRKLGVQVLPLCEEWPQIVYVFDELAMVVLNKDIKGVESRLVTCAQVMRKTRQGLVLATQHPKATVVSTMVRGQCAVRLCLRTKAEEATEAVLDSRRYRAHEIPFDLPGVGFVELPNGRVVKVRVPLVTQQDCRRIAEATAHLTPTLPTDRGWVPLFDPYEQETA